MKLDDWFGGANIVEARAKIVAILTAKPGQARALEELLRGMVAPSRAEPGNLRWDIWQDSAEPGRFVLDELYRDQAAVAAHRGTAHFQHYLAVIDTLAQRQAHVVLPFVVADLVPAPSTREPKPGDAT
ncbi:MULTISPECIES: putative quinol monooxygenase [unclassified Lysobacter]|uniref:putative quinol monooxygenase n=1 Tax=unclassified Lysobacter TaxID=2635362 RepID=UPI001C23D29C|nr:putative quinol monooxygenase [Lysobacter sp. MMG2]MBU8977808.1 antibiotic biosynthesis monooxygenase [Lysobacter sp. MMG2]